MDEKSELLARAEARFKRQDRNATEGAQARKEYDDKQAAIAKNMHRLRAERLAREANSSVPSPSGAPVLSKKQAKHVHLGK